MAIQYTSGECPECEGDGRDLDLFSPRAGLLDMVPLDCRRRSDGIPFGFGKCPICDGIGKVGALVTPQGGAIVSIWPLRSLAVAGTGRGW